MYHIYLDEEAVNAFALRLVKSEHFRDGTYTLYADVPVKCFGYEAPYYHTRTNLNTMDVNTAAQTVDFVVTKGTNVVLGITTEVMTAKSRNLFSGVLSLIPRVEVPFAGTAQRKYRQLYHRVRDALEEQEKSTFSGFSLTPISVELSEQELKNKHFLNYSGNVSAYGRAHGVFFRYKAGEDDTLERQVVSSAAALRDYLRAVNWQRDGSCSALQELLDTSIGELFRNHSQEWNRLNDTMVKLSGLKSYPSFAPNSILEDYPELVYRLRCRVEDGNEENQQIMKLTEDLLTCIADVLADERTAERFEVLRMPLRGYFEEAALRMGLYYPEWLYNQAVRPFLNEARFAGTFTLQDLLACWCRLPKDTPFPSLMEILVAPLCNPELVS